MGCDSTQYGLFIASDSDDVAAEIADADALGNRFFFYLATVFRRSTSKPFENQPPPVPINFSRRIVRPFAECLIAFHLTLVAVQDGAADSSVASDTWLRTPRVKPRRRRVRDWQARAEPPSRAQSGKATPQRQMLTANGLVLAPRHTTTSGSVVEVGRNIQQHQRSLGRSLGGWTLVALWGRQHWRLWRT